MKKKRGGAEPLGMPGSGTVRPSPSALGVVYGDIGTSPLSMRRRRRRLVPPTGPAGVGSAEESGPWPDRGGEPAMSAEHILTIYNQHTVQGGTPPSLSNESPALYVGYFENRFGEQWIFTFDRTTREAHLRGGDVDWATVSVVREGRVDGLILGREEAAWLQACWRAATG
jgi:hypothetical protein